jgi:hypothetical protein
VIDINALAEQWLVAKRVERDATESRRAIEDAMLAAIPKTDEGTKQIKSDEYSIKVTYRIDRKVDAELVQEIAAEHGLSEHLGRLFRWKPEVNMTAWKAADESITRPLAAAITAKPGRPSFAITIEE